MVFGTKTVRRKFIAKGTTCESCEKIISRQAMSVEGVKDVDFDYSTETGCVEFDPEKTDMESVLASIESKGYACSVFQASPAKDGQVSPVSAAQDQIGSSGSRMSSMAWFVIALGVIVIGYFILGSVEGIGVPVISQGMGYGLLFIVGLLTGFHCIAMCGGFVVSYATADARKGRKPHASHLLYAVGKLISYTLIGAAFGFIGSIIAFTPLMRGVAGIFAGLFLVLFGLKMLNIIPALRKIQFRTPKALDKFVGSKQGSGPLVIGLLNGLMIACGPLQAIYIMAAGSGSPVEGATMLFVFALGTLPVMIGFGYVTSIISSKLTHKILKVSGVVVILLGVIMVNRGLSLTGMGYDFNSVIATVSASGGIDSVTGKASAIPSGSVAELEGGYQTIRMDVTNRGWEPDRFVLQKGVPVKWIIDGKEINGCNNAIQVPKLGIEFDIKDGEQVIEFTPDEEGVIPWSCWMGMIPGTFIVTADTSDTAAVEQQVASAPAPSAGSCGCGCGG